jgi:hypothetical protein
MMELRKMNINSQYYDVISYEDYAHNKDIYDPKHTAIMDTTYNVALPILPKLDDTSVGIRTEGTLVSLVKYPETAEDKRKYSLDNMIDMSNPRSYKEAIETSQKLKDVEREILLTVDNVTHPVVGSKDTPAMQGLKEAVSSKECDINSYSHRFGPNFANDKRILADNDVSIKKLIKYGNSMDIKISITFEDKDENVPNPIGKKITKVITGENVSGGYE